MKKECNFLLTVFCYQYAIDIPCIAMGLFSANMCTLLISALQQLLLLVVSEYLSSSEYIKRNC